MPGARPELIRAVAMLEPWEGGADQGLWVVHELDRVDKHRLVLSAAVTLGRIERHGDSYDLTTVKKYSGFDVNRPLPMEPVEWTPVEEGTVLMLPLADASFGVTATTLKFDVVLAEPQALRNMPAAAAMMTLVSSAEEIIRDLSPLA
jgi:hypothetical protein